VHASFTFSSDHINASFRCSLDGAAYAACYRSVSLGPLAQGSHIFAVKASDAGLTSDPATFHWTIATPGGDVGTVPAALASATTVGQAQQDLSLFFAQYHMTVAITDIRPSQLAQRWDTWTPIGEGDLGALKGYGLALLDEWAKYPLDFIRVTRVTGVAFVTHLAVSGQLRAATYDVDGGVLYDDVGYVGYQGGEYVRLGIHHEFDHLLTYNVLGPFGQSDPT
jgi:hypothetical protein